MNASQFYIVHTLPMFFVLRCLASVKALPLANPWSGVLPNVSCLFYRPLGLIHDRIVKSKGEKWKWEEEQKNTVWPQNKFSVSVSSLISHLLRSFVCGGVVFVVAWTWLAGCVSTQCVVCPLLSQSIRTVRRQTRDCCTEYLEFSGLF